MNRVAVFVIFNGSCGILIHDKEKPEIDTAPIFPYFKAEAIAVLFRAVSSHIEKKCGKTAYQREGKTPSKREKIEDKF